MATAAQLTKAMAVTMAVTQIPVPVPRLPDFIGVNSSVTSGDRKRLSEQSRDILAALREKAMFNFELIVLPKQCGGRRIIHNMTARISEIRAYLRSYGWTVATYPLQDGVWLYRLMILDHSSSEHRIPVRVEVSDGAATWKCPCCSAEDMCLVEADADTEKVGRQVLKNPLCEKCKLRLES